MEGVAKSEVAAATKRTNYFFILVADRLPAHLVIAFYHDVQQPSTGKISVRPKCWKEEGTWFIHTQFPEEEIVTAISTPTSHYFTTPVKYIAAVVCLAVLLAACQTPEQKVVEAKENVANANQDLKEANRDARAQWQEDWLTFKRENDKDIADNERRIIDLRQQVRGVNTRYGATYNARIDELERRNNELRDRVDNCRDEGDAKWAEFKETAKRNMDNLKLLLSNVTIKNG